MEDKLDNINDEIKPSTEFLHEYLTLYSGAMKTESRCWLNFMSTMNVRGTWKPRSIKISAKRRKQRKKFESISFVRYTLGWPLFGGEIFL